MKPLPEVLFWMGTRFYPDLMAGLVPWASDRNSKASAGKY